MAFTIRRLGPGDVTAMRALNALFGRAFSDPHTYGGAPPIDAYLARCSARHMSSRWSPRPTAR